MTEPAPLPTGPLLTTERLAVWAQERPLADLELASAIIDAVTVLLRHYGSSTWDIATLPPRARDIGYIVAKNYYLNPRLLRQETTGPLQESIDAAALRGINLSEEEKAELAGLAGSVGEVDGLWTLGITRGPVETHRTNRNGTVVIFDERGAWPVEYLVPEEGWVFFPDGTEGEPGSGA